MNQLVRAMGVARLVPQPEFRTKYIPHPSLHLPRGCELMQAAREQCILEMHERANGGAFNINNRPTVKRIVGAVATYYGVTFADIISPRRLGHLIRPRHVVMYLARHTTTLALTVIGRQLGHRDHSTIHSGIRCIQNALDRGDLGLSADITTLRAILAGEGEKQ